MSRGWQSRSGREEPEPGRRRVLLAVHNLALLLAIRAVLGELGLRVTAVRSIEETLAVLNRIKEPFGLLVLDADMSTPTGCEKLADLVWKRSRDARVLLLSSSPREGVSQGLAQRVDVRVLPKPFRVEELEAICRDLLPS